MVKTMTIKMLSREDNSRSMPIAFLVSPTQSGFRANVTPRNLIRLTLKKRRPFNG